MRTRPRIGAFAALAAIACTGSSGSPPGERAATPAFSPGGGTYASARSVTISSATAGAVVHCTQDGSTPTPASPTCEAPIAVAASTILRAVATADGLADSDVATATYTIQPAVPRAAAPAFAPPGGTYASARSVTITSPTAGAVVHCTLDGSAPTAASPACTAPIAVSTTRTIRAIAIATGYADSEVTAASYTIEIVPPQAAAPTFAPPEGTYASAPSVTVTSATAGAVVHCTLDGSAPTAASPTCTAPIAVATTRTIRAIATATGHADSEVASATYTIEPLPRAATPAFWPPGGTYTSAQSVTVASATPGATLRCTADGTTPTAASPACAAPIAVSTTRTIRAIATAAGYTASEIGSATYTIGQEPTPLEALQALSDRRQLLAHQSVGANVLGGLARLLAANPGSGVQLVVEPASLAQVPLGGWVDAEVGTNGYPLVKLDDFDQMVRTRFGGGLDHAAMKFCFVDFTATTDVAGLWARYQAVMDALEADFPGRIVYWTVPLQTDHSGNPARAEFSDLVRSKYGPTGRVFDLADLESHDSQGNLVLVDGFPALAPEWTTDGGHLTDAFSGVVARAYVLFMHGIATGASP